MKGFIARILIGVTVGAVCAIPLFASSSLAMKYNLWLVLICFAILPILLTYPPLMYYSTILVDYFVTENESYEVQMTSKSISADSRA